MNSSSILPKDYHEILKDIKFLLERAKVQAYKAVDNIRVQTYWQMGERIVREELYHKEKADYGKYLIENLARDLGFSRRLMYEIVLFYRTYPIVQAVPAQLSWTHLVNLLYVHDSQERQFYETQTLFNAWSTRELELRIKKKEYAKAKNAGQLVVKVPSRLPVPEDIFKDVYNWDFLELNSDYNEKQLESVLLDNIQKILLEFGHGFAFMGSQQKILIAGQWHKVDLVFYHRFLRCTILVELKKEKFVPEFVGQMNKYLTYFRENKLEDEKDPIGLIICKEKDAEEVHYALGKLNKEIFVAEYKTYLPSTEEIKKKLKLIPKTLK